MMIKLPAFFKVWEKFTGKKSKSSPDLRILDIDKVHHIQKDHNLWLDSKGEKGVKADFSNCSLPGEVRFVRVDYEGVSFRGAHLCSIEFENMNLTGADFRDADLRNTKFKDVEGLSSGQLAGSDVTGAKLGEDIQKFESLDIIKEASKNARKLFLAMLLGCVYSIITIATTTDARLITNSSSSPLPIIGAEIPIAGFYWAAPLLLVSLYLYFHIYMQRLWERLAELPAVFPEGVPLDEKAYPWLLFGLVRKHFARLRAERPPLSGVQVLLSSLLAWWAVPGALLMFWLRFLPRHDWSGTGLHVILLGFAIGFGIISHWLSAETLKGTNNKCRKPPWKKGIAQGTIASGFFLLVSIGAITGIGPHDKNKSHPKTWVPRVLEKVAFGAFADLKDAEVSTRPPNWTGLEEREKEEVALVKGAKLNNSNLRYANAKGAFLVKADFSHADLEEADLRKANLLYANLFNTRFGSANLRDANLSGANLSSAFLVGANLSFAHLDSAYIIMTNLSGASLNFTYLVGANLLFTRLDSADLYAALLFDANLGHVSLAKANLNRALLDSADLEDANLQVADMREAKLKGVKNWLDIKSIRLANVWGVFDPPEGFLAWADSMGAVSAETDEEWIELITQQGKRVPRHLLR